MTRRSLIVAWEPLAVLLEDGLEELVREHHAEVGVHKDDMPLDVDWDGYATLEAKGMLKVLGARRKGRLIGYSSFFLLPHFHYHSTPHAPNDAIFVKTGHRMSGAGAVMVDVADMDLPAMVKPRALRITYHDKIALDYLRRLLESRGYVAQETVYSKIARAG